MNDDYGFFVAIWMSIALLWVVIGIAELNCNCDCSSEAIKQELQSEGKE